MIRDKFLIRLLMAGMLCFAGLGSLRAQVPPVSSLPPLDRDESLRRTLDAGAYREARNELEQVLQEASTPRERANLLFQTIEVALKGEEYPVVYELSTAFLGESPLDRRRWTVMYYRGLSAYHLGDKPGMIDTSIAMFNTYLTNPQNERRSNAYYWRGMADLEKSEWDLAESDFSAAYGDSLTEGRRDRALLGWALAKEHHNDIAGSAELLDRLFNEYPESDVLTDARLRRASLALRQEHPEQALNLLKSAQPRYRTQREEAQLLRGEASLQMGQYATAATDFKDFLSRFPKSQYTRNAQSGLAWAYMKNGDTPSARRMFDSLGRGGRDTLSLGGMYQSGVAAMLAGNDAEGSTALQTFVDKSPYDVYADRAYYLMGVTDYRAHRYKEARKNFQLITRLFPESPLRMDAYRMAGEASLALSDFGTAQYNFGQVRRLGATDALLAPSMYQEGICLYHLGRFKTSAERFGEFLKKYSSDAKSSDALVWRGEAQYQDGKFDDAEDSYREALKKSPDDLKRSQASYGIAWSLFEQKKFVAAAAAFEKFSKDYPDNPHVLDALLRRADCYYFMREYDKASALYAALSTAKNSSKNTEYAAFQLAMSYISRGENQRGIEQLREFLVRFPNSIYNEVVQFNIGWTYFSMEQYGPAITELRLLLRLYPESQLMPRILFNLGDAFYNTKEYDSARIYYQQVVEKFPNSPLVKDAMAGLRFTFEAQGKSGEALATIDKYMGNKPNGALQQDLLLNKADILFGQGDLAGAMDQYQKLLDLKPEKPAAARAVQQLGRISELRGDTAKAITYYTQILSDYGETETAPPTALALGIAYGRKKQYTDAVNILSTMPAKYPGAQVLGEAAYRLGLVYAAIPDADKARTQFNHIIAANPSDIFADRSRMQIARLDIDEKEYKRAIDTLEALVGRRSDDIAAEGLLLEGDAYMGMKKYVDALQSYKDVVDQYTDFPVLIERGHFGLANAYEKLRDKKHARAEYEEVVKSGLDAGLKNESEERIRRLRK